MTMANDGETLDRIIEDLKDVGRDLDRMSAEGVAEDVADGLFEIAHALHRLADAVQHTDEPTWRTR